MTSASPRFDRPAAIRHALRTLVARHGLHGASMSAVAKAAGVATGTAYVHYDSKDQLIYATYLEVKREMGVALEGVVDPNASAHDRFVQLWTGIYRHLADDPDRARFMVQLDSSPFALTAHAMAMASGGDPVMAQASAPDLVAHLAPLDLETLYDLGIGPAIRLAAKVTAETGPIDERVLTLVAGACWRAVAVG